MKNYLDPVYLVVNEDTWKTRVYAEIFASLVEIIDDIEEVEKDSNSLYKLVKFKSWPNLLCYYSYFSHRIINSFPRI